MKPILPKGIKPQLNKELNAYLKLDKEIKTLTSKKIARYFDYGKRFY